MKEMIRYGLILSLICLVAAGLLAGVNSVTRNRIIAQAQAEENAGLKEALPQAASFEAVESSDNEVIYYRALDNRGKVIGVTFKAQGKGYSGTVETLAGMLEDGTITAIKVIAQNETPGVGSKIAEPKFTEQFKDKTSLEGVQAITGATISSRAVIDSVKKKAEEIKGMLKNE
ncbi:MAG: RnfABCDGE type electron transport complex subunit G [Candidatus Omnitrophota bacterium]